MINAPQKILKTTKGGAVNAYNKLTKQKPLSKGVKAVDSVVIDSHVIGVAKRPVSSTYRLVAWTKGAAVDLVNPKAKLMRLTKPGESVPEVNIEWSMDLEAFEEHLDKVVGAKRSNGTMGFLIGGEEFFPRLEDALKEAKQSIDIRIFIFDNDDYGVRIADLLKEKDKEGVKIRVLLDGVGQIMGEGKVSATLPEGFESPGSMIKYLKKDSNIEVRQKPNPWFKADHTKTIVIDETIMFTGGMNIGREYRYDWHDLMVEIEGPMVQVMDEEFKLAWKHSGTLGDLAYFKGLFSKLKIEGDDLLPDIRPLFTRANNQQIYKAQLEAIKFAKKYVYVSNAYFSDEGIINALIRARQRGVDVRVILPEKGNHEIMNKNNIVAANKMYDGGIRVFFYPGMTHIKAAIYDGWMTTGSANFDKLSFRDNLEFNIATSNPEIVERFKEELFEPDFEKSQEMKEKLKSGITEFILEKIAEQL